MAVVPVEQLTPADFAAMIGRDAEGARLEFKVDIPVHPQSKREQASKSVDPPRDAWWSGRALADHGRDELVAEVVAFANAQGGRLLLGIDEEAGTTLAKAICPIPRIAELEGRFSGILLSCVEPRLPHASVCGVETDGIGGGVLVVEVQPSRLGPHRVAKTLLVPVRRGDKCVPMTMAEVHGMVLRNARRFDDVTATLDARIAGVEPMFIEFLNSKIDIQVTGGTAEDHVRTWLKQKALSAIAIRVVICAHDDLGIPRLNSFDSFVPEKTTVGQATATGYVSTSEMTALWPTRGGGEKYLGGVRQRTPWSHGTIEFSAGREGVVEQTFLFFQNQQDHTVSPAQVAGIMGSVLGIYDLLRVAADRPDMPAEVAVEVLTRGEVRIGSGQLAVILPGRLPARATLPRRTVATEADFSDIMGATIQDLLDSANNTFLSGSEFAYSRNSFIGVDSTAR